MFENLKDRVRTLEKLLRELRNHKHCKKCGITILQKLFDFTPSTR